MGSADLRRIDALLQLRAALLHFRQSTSGISSQLRARIDRAKTELDRRRRRLDVEIEALEDQVRSDDEDDGEDARRSLDDAYASRSDLREQARRLASAAARHDSAAASWLNALGTTVPAAAAFLAHKYNDASDYLKAGLSVGVGAVAVSDQPPFEIESEVADTSPRQYSMLTDPANATCADDLPVLPSGFSWISISRINRSELPPRDDFPKVSYETMRAGFERLWAELLPLVSATPAANRETFRKFDESHGRVDPMGFVHEESLAHLWDQFFEQRFGNNHIRITAGSDADPWGVDNGRHRIRVAQDLGWKYVPGRLVRFESKRKS